ncbi:MAG: hypothetical protein WBC44_02260 [Planctomycetaceae bacterium]
MTRRDDALTTLNVPQVVVAFVPPENVPSCGVAVKLGLNHVDRTVIAGLEHRVYALGRSEATDERGVMHAQEAASAGAGRSGA